MAALTAGRAGLRVILADEDFRLGGRLNAETLAVGDQSGADWASAMAAELASLPNVRLMPRTTCTMRSLCHSSSGSSQGRSRKSGHVSRGSIWNRMCEPMVRGDEICSPASMDSAGSG